MYTCVSKLLCLMCMSAIRLVNMTRSWPHTSPERTRTLQRIPMHNMDNFGLVRVQVKNFERKKLIDGAHFILSLYYP